MSKHYPYIQEKTKIKNFECERCHLKKDEGFKIEWRVDWFQGNCEFEKICKPCLVEGERKETERRMKQAEIDRKNYIREMKREQERFDKLLAKLREKYTVKVLTPYQLRINDRIDIYPTNEKYHDIKQNKRGYYNNLLPFLASIFLTDER